jgi:hypothetical protein
MTPEFDSKAAYKACAPLHWDAEEWNFWAWSEDDESLTDGEDLQFLLDGEMEDEDDDDDVSWEAHDSSSKEEDGDESTEEDPTAGSFLRAKSSDEDGGGDPDDGVNGDDGSTSDDVPKTTSAMAAAVMTMVMSVWSLQSSAASSQTPTGGRLASMYQTDRLALGAIGPSFVMTFLFF